jgi:hypothetical protein
MAGPWEEYAQPAQAKPWEQYGGTTPQTPVEPGTQEMSEARDVLSTPTQEYKSPVIRQAGQGMFEGVTGFPGYPVDIAAGLGNFMRRNFGDGRDVPLSETPLRDWGSEGWSRAARQATGAVDNGAPQTETQRLARKAGGFVGGSAPFGATGLALAPEAFIGSEVGRAADQVAPGLTRGYGEFAGGVVGPGVRPTVRAGVQATGKTLREMRHPSSYKPPDGVPTNEMLRAESKAAYQRASDAGVIFNSDGLTRLAREIRETLGGNSYVERNQPRIGPVLDELNEKIANGGRVTLEGLESIRQMAGDAAERATGKEQLLSSKIIEHIDDFLDDVKPSETLGGSSHQASAALREARYAWHRLQKSTDVDLAIQKAVNRASSTNSGANIENTMRQNLRRILDKLDTQKIKSGRYRGWTDEEVSLLRRAVEGSGTQNLLRYLGKLSPENMGIGIVEGLSGLAAASVAPAGVPIALGVAGTGLVAKRLSEGLESAKVNALSNAIRRGKGPTPPDRSVPPNFEPPAPGRPPPRGPQPQIGATMYSNPLDPAAFKALFLRRREPPQSSINRPLRSDVLDQQGAPSNAAEADPLTAFRNLNRELDAEFEGVALDRLNQATGQKPPTLNLDRIREARDRAGQGRPRQEQFQREAATRESAPWPEKGEVTLGDHIPGAVSWQGSRLYFPIRKGGQEVGFITGRVKGDQFRVGLIMTSGGPQSLSPSVVRRIGRDLRAKLPPSVKTIGGERISGARRGPARKENWGTDGVGEANIPASALAIPLGLGLTALASGFDQSGPERPSSPQDR